MKTPRFRPGRSQSGFTLLECLYSIMIIGLGITALMLMMASGTTVNAAGNDLSSAVFLANELRAMTDDEVFANLPAFNNQTWQGVDAQGNTIAGLGNFQQRLTVQKVNPTTLAADATSTTMVRLTATVANTNGTSTQFSWLRTP